MAAEQIYYIVGDQRRGPFTLEQIAQLGLHRDTMVWYPGLANWMPAWQAPMTASLFINPGFNTPPAAGPYGYNNNAYIPQRPDTYLVWAILTTLFCCLPFGIVSIVYAARVDALYNRGDYEAAQDSSNKAKQWAKWSALSSVIIFALYFFAYLFLGFVGLAYAM